MHSTAFAFISFPPPSGIRRQGGIKKTTSDHSVPAVVHASLLFIPCALSSSFTLPIHFFGCLNLLLVPSTCPYSATAGSLLSSLLVTCPNPVSLLFLIFSMNVGLSLVPCPFWSPRSVSCLF